MQRSDDWGLYAASDQVAPAVFVPEYFDGEDSAGDTDEPAVNENPKHGETGQTSGPVIDQDLQLREDELPEFVFVPSERVVKGVTNDTRIELRQVEGGGLALLTYSSLETLVECCGPNQGWVAFPGDRVQELLQATGANVAVLDAPLSPELRKG